MNSLAGDAELSVRLPAARTGSLGPLHLAAVLARRGIECLRLRSGAAHNLRFPSPGFCRSHKVADFCLFSLGQTRRHASSLITRIAHPCAPPFPKHGSHSTVLRGHCRKPEMMRASVVLALIGYLTGFALAETQTASSFEDKSFNVTQALLDKGVKPSQLPPPASANQRSSGIRCAAAVSL